MAVVQQVPWESGSLTGKFCFGTCGPEDEELRRQRAELNRQRAQLEQQRLEQEQLRQQRLEFERQRTLLELEQAKLKRQQDELERQRAELEKQRAQTPEPSPKPTPTPSQRIFQGEQIDFAAIFTLDGFKKQQQFQEERDMFETTKQYQVRYAQLLEKFNEYREKFNQASQKGDRRYQAGVAYLKDYDADGETLLVNLKWQAAWVKQFLGTQAKNGIIKIAPGDARALWKAGKNKPLFVTVALAGEHQKISSDVLVEGGKAWTVSIPPIPEMVTIPAGRFRINAIKLRQT